MEQRIGRIDRFGQKSDVICIHNVIVEGTVEDRILHRLYERIGIFEESVGDLETILGATVSDIQRDYVSGKLTPEEADKRVDQAARAIKERQLDLERLQEEAGELFGHEEYIRSEMDRVARLGRYVSPEAMLSLLKTFLQSHHPSVRLFEEEEGIYSIRLTDSLNHYIYDACPGEHIGVGRARDGRLRFTMDGDIAFRRADVELVNVLHPLIRTAVVAVSRQLEDPTARVAQVTVLLPPSDSTEPDIEPGTYFVLSYTQTIEGIRSRRLLETIAWSRSDATLLDSEMSERLLHLVVETGVEWERSEAGPRTAPMTFGVKCGPTRAIAIGKYSNAKRKRTKPSLSVVKKLLDAEYLHQSETIQKRLNTARARKRAERVLKLFEKQLANAEGSYRDRLKELKMKRRVSARLSEPVAACVVEVKSRKPAE